MTLDTIKKMFGNFSTDSRVLLKKAPSWLPQPTAELLYNLKFEQVEEPLDADWLWERGGQVQNQGKTRQASLRSTLQDHPKNISRKLNGNKFHSVTYEMFSDVAVWINAQLWHEQELSGYENLFVMADKLEFLHARDFMGLLYQNRAPHYTIMPLATLERQQMLCQFGLGVFIPGPDDRQTGLLAMHNMQNQGQPLPEWWFYQKEADHLPVKKIVRPAGFYEKQYSLLISNSLDHAAIQSPLWVKDEGGHILINSRNDPVSFTGDGQIIQVGGSHQEKMGSVCPFHAKANPQDQLSLRIKPVNPSLQPDVAIEPHIRHNPLSDITFVDVQEKDTANPLSGFTFVDTDKEENRVEFALYLTALALPRSRSLPGNSRYWVMSFDGDGFPAATPAETHWQLRGDTLGNLDWKMASEQVWQRAALPDADTPAPLPIAGNQQTQLQLQPSPLPETLLALYPLPIPLALAGLDPGVYTLGRDADIVIDLLARDDSLPNRGGNDTLNNLRFSRQHLALELQDGQLAISQISGNALSYVEHDGVAFTALAAPDSTELQADDRLIVGCYVLQFKSLTTG